MHDDEIHFLSLTDIHFNPFYSCTAVPCPLILHLQQAPVNQWSKLFMQYDTELPRYKRDSNYQLLISSLVTAKQASEKEQAQFILILGDFLGHDLRKLYKKYSQDKSISGYQAFIKNTMVFLSQELNNAFPKLDVYVLVGNNDTYHNDYYLEPHGQFFKDMNGHWSKLIKNDKNRNLFKQQFAVNGFYAIELPKLTLIVLNSVLFSVHVRGEGVKQAADEELNWLHHQLQLLKTHQKKAMIAMHIPVGIDLYATTRIRIIRLLELWQPSFLQRFQADLQEYAPQIAGIFVGHLHSNWFQIHTFKNSNEIPVIGTLSISPIFGNKPGFKIYSYSSQSLQIKDFALYTYSMDDKKNWKVVS